MINMPGVDIGSVPTKRQSLIPFPRVGKRDSISNRLSFTSYDWPKRDAFKRRLTRRSYWDKSSRAFNRRILRSGGEDESSWDMTGVPDHSLYKRQSLIPFPRTGKRSGGQNKEENQVYVFESPEDDDEENVGSMLVEANIGVDFEDDYEPLYGSLGLEAEDNELGRIDSRVPLT